MKQCPSQKIKIKNQREIVDCDNLSFPWPTDPNGYFLVKINNRTIHCCWVTNNKLTLELKGKNPDKIIKEIVKRNLCNNSTLAYISSELTIASNCIRNDEEYVQR